MGLKKKSVRHCKKLASVELRREDINSIVDVLESNANAYAIDIEGYEIESVDDLDDIDEDKVNRIHFSIIEPYIHLEMQPHTIRIYYYGDSLSLGIVKK